MNNRQQILPIMVVYETDLLQCHSYQTLLRDCGWTFVLYDNSTKPINQHHASARILYHHNPHNGGVSAAYNHGARQAEVLGFSYVLLLDQDTTFGKDFLPTLCQAIGAHPSVGFWTTKMEYGNHLPFSPVKVSRFTCHGVNLSEGEYSLWDYLPVNSGTCMKTEFFWQVGGYSEQLRLDFADFDFFIRARQHAASSFFLMSHVAQQQFSNQEKDEEKRFKRYQIYIEGARLMPHRSFFIWHVLRHTLRLTLKSCRLRYLMYFCKYYFSKTI